VQFLSRAIGKSFLNLTGIHQKLMNGPWCHVLHPKFDHVIDHGFEVHGKLTQQLLCGLEELVLVLNVQYRL
jgi:hypothetical protein